MRCLWIGRDLPYPADSGDAIYSSRLLEAFRDAGADVTVLCRARDDDRHAELPAGIAWRVVTSPARSELTSLLTPKANIGHRHDTRAMRSALAAALADPWDAVLLDHIGAGWALPQVRGHRRLVYLSQNHEASTRKLVADTASGSAPRRLALRYDAWKAARLERAVVDAADLVTTVTEEDRRLHASVTPTANTLVLTPGYLGRVVETRRITDELPRRAVVVGSFDWVAKRMNLEELLEVADPLFRDAGAELVVVGRGPDAWLERLRSRMTATRLTGFVDSVDEHLDQARIGIVAEPRGGGFKIKVLDYIFSRVPVAALSGSFAGVPLVPGVSDIEAPTLEELIEQVLAALHDVERLNRLHDAAIDACRGRFDWHERGAALFDAVGAL